MYIRILILILFLCISPGDLFASVVRSANTEVELVPQQLSIQPGQPFWVALRMKMDDQWHVYWKNPGDAGLAPTITWDLPEGFKASPIHWPYPHQIKVAHLISYGYEGEVFLLSKITAPAFLNEGEAVKLAAHIDWLSCKIECVPGQADLTLNLLVRKSIPQDNKAKVEDFAQTHMRLPIKDVEWEISAKFKNKNYLLALIPRYAPLAKLKKAIFFPERDDIIDHGADQNIEWNKSRYELWVPLSKLQTKSVDRLKGIIYSPEGWDLNGLRKSIAIDIPVHYFKEVSEILINNTITITTTFKEDAGSKRTANIGLIILFAFIGGLILNLMPCVLPVLSLKVLNLIHQARERSTKAWQHGLFYALGILVSFWILAGCLLILRSVGIQVGWGFQFQSPVFLIVLSTIFFVFALNLFGMFEIGTSLKVVVIVIVLLMRISETSLK